NQASTGTSQVSVTTKIVKASWIAARPQWYFASIGSTNRVQPYCRFAIIAMQGIPIASCSQREALASTVGSAAAWVVIVMLPPAPGFETATSCRDRQSCMQYTSRQERVSGTAG